MQSFSFDSTLALAFLFLLKVLVQLALVSLVAGVFILPLFFAVMALVNFWIAAGETDLHAQSERRHRLLRWRSQLLLFTRWGIPVLSLASTLFLVAYFLGGSTKEGTGKAQAGWARLTFDSVTRSLAGGDRQEVSTGGEEEDKAKKSTMMIRTIAMLGLLVIGPFPSLMLLLTWLSGRVGIVLIMRSLNRNLLRTSLTFLAIFVLVSVVTLVWSVLGFLDKVTAEKEGNLKAIITEKNQIPSQMAPSHEQQLMALLDELPPESQPKDRVNDIMTWSFVGGSLDPKNRTMQNSLFLFSMEPRKLLTMMDGLDELTGEQQSQLERATTQMEKDITCAIIGKERLKQMKVKVGQTIELTSFNYADLVFKLKIIGEFPDGRYDQSAVMNRDYLYRQLQDYEAKNHKAHPLADKCMNLIWIRLPDRRSFELLAEKVNSSDLFKPAVKMETASSAIGSFLQPFKDFLFGARYVLSPALLITMALVISNAISIGVRERRTEMAVLKVLGFRPWMVLVLVLGEAALIGILSGFLATATLFALVNALGGLPLPIAFFPKFYIPAEALWWGPAIGLGTAFAGSVLPALNARSVKVSEVFSRVV